MPKYWIFVSVPYTDFNTSNIQDMLQKIKTSQVWPIGRRTRYRTELSKGDKALFYQGGEGGRKIVGDAEVASSLLLKENGMYDYVIVKDFEFWEKPVEIGKIMRNLSFIKNQKHWGIYFQGGVVRISEKDYMHILRRAGLSRVDRFKQNL